MWRLELICGQNIGTTSDVLTAALHRVSTMSVLKNTVSATDISNSAISIGLKNLYSYGKI